MLLIHQQPLLSSFNGADKLVLSRHHRSALCRRNTATIIVIIAPPLGEMTERQERGPFGQNTGSRSLFGLTSHVYTHIIFLFSLF